MKAKVTGSNPGYLLKSFLLYRSILRVNCITSRRITSWLLVPGGQCTIVSCYSSVKKWKFKLNIYILEQLYNCSRIHYLYHILRRIANQAQRKKIYFPCRNQTTHTSISHFFAASNPISFLISRKLRVQSQMDVILITWSSSLNMLNS